MEIGWSLEKVTLKILLRRILIRLQYPNLTLSLNSVFVPKVFGSSAWISVSKCLSDGTYNQMRYECAAKSDVPPYWEGNFGRRRQGEEKVSSLAPRKKTVDTWHVLSESSILDEYSNASEETLQSPLPFRYGGGHLSPALEERRNRRVSTQFFSVS